MKNYKRESNSIYKYTLANLNLRSSKSTSGDIITVIPQGSKVEILDGAEDWYDIITIDDMFIINTFQKLNIHGLMYF